MTSDHGSPSAADDEFARSRRHWIGAMSALAATGLPVLDVSAASATHTPFDTRSLPLKPDVTAPDGSDVRILLRLAGGSMAQFALPPGKTSVAVSHRSVEEVWYFVSGRGEMWRSQGDRSEIVVAESGVCVTIPLGTKFQFRTVGSEPLVAVAITMPPWPGDGEALVAVGPWVATT